MKYIIFSKILLQRTVIGVTSLQGEKSLCISLFKKEIVNNNIEQEKGPKYQLFLLFACVSSESIEVTDCQCPIMYSFSNSFLQNMQKVEKRIQSCPILVKVIKKLFR